jgi:DNA-binding beta-propeller fold protein YncE
VANGSANSVTVIDGATQATSSVAVGISPYAVGVDPVAHTVYVANYGGKSVTVIDDPTLAATTVPTSSEPNAVAVNPVTHMAYVSNITGGSVTEINGAITSAAAVAEQGGTTYYTQRLYAPTAPGAAFPAPYAIAVNPALDKVYAADKNGGLFIVDVDRNTTVPLTAIATGVTDSSTVSTTNVFQTRNPSPSFTVQVTSSFTSTPAYSGVAGATNPPPSAVYYKVDGGSQWSLAKMTSAVGANPASFSIGLSAQTIGPHTLYFTPVYGNMGATIDSSSTAPETGNLTAYFFQIDPPL